MLIPAKLLARYWKLSPREILHVGAHQAEELDAYLELNWGNSGIFWVEALPDKATYVSERVRPYPLQQVLNFVAWDTTGDTVSFSETNNGQSSSALELGDHLIIYPEIQVTKRHQFQTSRIEDAIDLSSLKTIGLVNLDIQGAEFKALIGMGEHIEKVQAIYSEVNLRHLYAGGSLMGELDDWLEKKGFERVDFVLLQEGWGDALWLRRDRVPRWKRARRFLRIADSKLLHFMIQLLPPTQKTSASSGVGQRE